MKKYLIILLIVITILWVVLKDSDIRLSKNFTLSEFTKTSYPVNNEPSPEHIINLRRLVVNFLQPLRDYFNKPLIITSGYRSKELNSKLRNSSKNSQHLEGMAADFKITGETNESVIKAIKDLGLSYDQLIDEQLYYENGKLISHIHISYINPYLNRNNTLIARNKKDNLNAVYFIA